MKPPKFTKGDLVLVHWVDITSDPVGDPAKAMLSVRRTPGLFDRYQWQTYEGKRIRVLICRTTVDAENDEQSGYDVYPMAVVIKIQRLRVEEP